MDLSRYITLVQLRINSSFQIHSISISCSLLCDNIVTFYCNILGNLFLLRFKKTFSCHLFGDVLFKTTKLNQLVLLQEEVCINSIYLSLSLSLSLYLFPSLSFFISLSFTLFLSLSLSLSLFLSFSLSLYLSFFPLLRIYEWFLPCLFQISHCKGFVF